MCGIIGFWNRQGSPKLYQSSLDSLRHRGPDDEGFWSNEILYLGMRRLSIIDISGGAQPIWNEDRTCCIVYNGELYNYLDLRPELIARGHRFQTNSDTEVILHAYEEWGVNCLKRLNGMFAFAIWDGRNERLVLARDRIGEKPLYYIHRDSGLAFASEAKALLIDPSISRELDIRGLTNFLMFGHAIAPNTIYKGIKKLLPGHFLVMDRYTFKTARYWDVGDEPPEKVNAQDSQNELAERILVLLDDSVRRRMIADVPVGAFLSGGIDSSAIVALMKRHATGAVKTFSVGFDVAQRGYNELSDARRVAQQFGTEHHELHIEDIDLLNALRTLIYHHDEPFGDPASFPVYLLSRFAAQHVKVVLTGDGGDELFGGYRRYSVDRLAKLYAYMPDALSRDVIPELVNRLPRFRRVKRTFETLPIKCPWARYAAWVTVFDREMQEQLLQPDILDEQNGYNPTEWYGEYYNALPTETANDHLNKLMYVDLKTRLTDAYMEKTDKATMACSLEARLPLLDHRLVELAFQIPGHFKISGWSMKTILKSAIQSIVPDYVIKKPKHGFEVPLDPWFRGSLKEFTSDLLLDRRTRERGYFNPKMIDRLLQEHATGRHVWSGQLWLLLSFEMWCRIYLDREAV